MHEGMGNPRARTEERRQKPSAVQSDHNNNHLRPPPPPPQEPQQCPRCDSFNTKFCYYNNYSLSQPRFFCKACRRYWTRGGTLRNVPVGGGCRKGKRTKIAPSSSTTSSSAAAAAEPSSSLLQTQTQTLPLLHRQHDKLQSFASPAISPNLGISLPPTAALRVPGINLISPPASYVGGAGGSGGLLSSLSSWIHHRPTSSLNQHHLPASSFNQTLNSDFSGGGEDGSPSTNFSPYNLGLSQLQGYDLSAYGQQIHHRLQQQQRQHQQFQEVEYFHHQVGNSKDSIKNNLDQQPPTMCPLDQAGLMNSSQSSRLTDWNRSFNPANNANLNPTAASDVGGGFWNITTVGNSDAGAAGSSLNQTHWTDLP